MKRHGDPRALLHSLLDRYERDAGTVRRITAHPTQAFAETADRERLVQALTAARDTGGVTLDWDRDAPHLIARVVLADANALYRHIGRTPLSVQQKAGAAALRDFETTTDVSRELLAEILAKWGAGKPCLAIAPGATDEALALLRAAEGAFTIFDSGPMPLRTRSARLLGDSKAIERHLSKLLSFLKANGRLSPDMSRDEALDSLGLAKFPQPVLIAGPVSVHGSQGDLTYVGVPPEALCDATLLGPVRSVLTIENLESFHRHVREVRGEEDVVIYCGGFPAQGVVRALRHIAASASVPVIHHWGDIDPGGIRIGRFIEQSVPVPVIPHLMSAELATANGRAVGAIKALESFADNSAFQPLAKFLASDAAYWLEQEVLDPVRV
ncbi:Wadjet anti-phage system protein JetD domain-containing protein [Sphingomonas colocasiae]|uniref:DUF2220 domain-containing protein n=1 Tax=Sphingomonas colocasiae TaxID=1848973 RepID=A0ABS7PIH2_9SPHN|nr:Wadjet anti-phage system protein JetD domain-containing protein [Sphingomonas colocasiae]MBY8821093.1 DUF2220 domain-containing protein [Sphingomonas colocasiae]